MTSYHYVVSRWSTEVMFSFRHFFHFPDVIPEYWVVFFFFENGCNMRFSRVSLHFDEFTREGLRIRDVIYPRILMSVSYIKVSTIIRFTYSIQRFFTYLVWVMEAVLSGAVWSPALVHCVILQIFIYGFCYFSI